MPFEWTIQSLDYWDGRVLYAFVEKDKKDFASPDQALLQYVVNSVDNLSTVEDVGWQDGALVNHGLLAYGQFLRLKNARGEMTFAQYIQDERWAELFWEVESATEAAEQVPAETSKKVLARFPKIEGLKWPDVEIAFVANDAIRIRAGGKAKRFTFAEMGFKDARRGDLPNSRWKALLDLAERGQTYFEDRHGSAKNLAHNIRQRLRIILQIGKEDDPIPWDNEEKRYRLAFRLVDEREGGAY